MNIYVLNLSQNSMRNCDGRHSSAFIAGRMSAAFAARRAAS
jgi:hypothetical protein